MISTTIDKILKKDADTCSIYIGSKARDELPNIVYPTCFVLNTHPRDKEGEHWLALYFNKDKKCFFFDSYGNHPSFFGLSTYIKDNSLHFSYNNRRLQGESRFCGIYCCLFLLFASKNKLKTFYANFYNDESLNDLLIQKYFLKFK